VELCARPHIGESESTNSSLSPPPKSPSPGANGDKRFGRDARYPAPYVAGQVSTYPRGRDDSANEDATDVDDSEPMRLPAITDIQKFMDSLEDHEDLTHEELFHRVENAQAALVAWQDEWMNLEVFVKKAEGRRQITTQKDANLELTNPFGIKNPRIPKPHLTGQGQQDLLESFAYGYEHLPHPQMIGKQDPLKQRYNASTSGMSLRARNPSKKAMEVDSSQSPEADEGVTTRHRSQRVIDGSVNGQTSRMNSESRETPFRTFKSGARVGRPPTKSRLQAIQREEGMPPRSRTNRNSDTNGNVGPHHPGQNTAIQSTEDYTEDEASYESRLGGTSLDTSENDISDDEEDKRHRQDTSDFEGDGHRKTGRPKVATKAKAHSDDKDDVGSAEEADLENMTAEERLKAKRKADKKRAWATRRRNKAIRDAKELGIPYISADEDESIDPIAKGNPIPKAVRKSLGGETTTVDNVPSTIPTPTPKVSKKNIKIGTPGSAQTPGVKVKKEKGQSAASRNMMNRWAKKKEAEALGLVPPPIGRYKGGKKNAPNVPAATSSVTPGASQPPTVATPGSNTQAKVVTKRKREEKEVPVDMSSIPAADSQPPKKKIRRSKKEVQASDANASEDVLDPSNTITDPAPEIQGNLLVSHTRVNENSPPRGKRSGRQAKPSAKAESEAAAEQAVPKPRKNRRANTPPKRGDDGSIAYLLNPEDDDEDDDEAAEGDGHVPSGVIGNPPATITPAERAPMMMLGAILQGNSIDPYPPIRPKTAKPVVDAHQLLDEHESDDEVILPQSSRSRGRRPNAPVALKPLTLKTDQAEENEYEPEEPPPKRTKGGRPPKSVSKGKGKGKSKVKGDSDSISSTPVGGPTSAPSSARPSGTIRRRHMQTDGADDDDHTPSHARKISAYEEWQALASPTGAVKLGKRSRRSTLAPGTPISGKGDDDEDVQGQVEKQFASEYEHYQALASPRGEMMLGKRKRKPVFDLEEVMRIEAGEEDDDDFDEE
jgi:hypothetical protein